uniref:Olfactory receptor n=1 Tax=Salarias fasciatus TaxID=181472 RepID=A0A672GFM6_SALFA
RNFVSFFVLEAFLDVGLVKYLVFLFIMCFYVLTLFSNLLLIVVICVNRTLHEPMYLFLVSLFVNELYGSSGLFPLILVQVLSDSHIVSAPLCFLQIFCLYMYVNVEFYTLAVMSYDRYLAICRPLQYGAQMRAGKVALLLAVSWLLPVVVITVMTSLTVSLRLCGNVLDTLYCNNYSVVNLACSDTTTNNIYGLVYTFLVLAGLTVLIVFSYLKILKVCFSSSAQTRQKAASTCVPHLASLLNFSFGCFFEIAQSRVRMGGVPAALRIILSMYFVTCQPLFNPVLYGLNLTKIRVICRNLLFHGP